MRIEYTDNYLMHFNENHDPKSGRFTFGKRRYMTTYKDSEGNIHEQLTLKGQQRYERAHAKNIAKPKDKRIRDEDELVNPDQWVRDDLDSASDIINSAKSMVESASKIRTEFKSTKGTKRLDLSNMTTQQIREANEREAAERRYNELFNPPKESQVSKFVDGFFKYALPAMSFAGGAVALLVGIKNLREGK